MWLSENVNVHSFKSQVQYHSIFVCVVCVALLTSLVSCLLGVFKMMVHRLSLLHNENIFNVQNIYFYIRFAAVQTMVKYACSLPN